MRSLNPSILNTSKSAIENPSVAIESVQLLSIFCESSPLFPKSLLPILSIEIRDFQAGEIDSFNAAEVHIDFVGVGSRNVKRRHAAGAAKVVFRCTCVESVSSQVISRSEQ